MLLLVIKRAIIDVLVEKVKRGINKTKFKTCVIAEVAANQYLRNELIKTYHQQKLFFLICHIALIMQQ